MDSAILIDIANRCFLSPGLSRHGCYRLPHTFNWSTLKSLACTCKCLAEHLQGLRQFHDQLEKLFLDQELAVPARWNLDKDRLGASYYVGPPDAQVQGRLDRKQADATLIVRFPAIVGPASITSLPKEIMNSHRDLATKDQRRSQRQQARGQRLTRR